MDINGEDNSCKNEGSIGLEMGEGKMNEFMKSDFSHQLKILHAYSELIKIKAMNKNLNLQKL